MATKLEDGGTRWGAAWLALNVDMSNNKPVGAKPLEIEDCLFGLQSLSYVHKYNVILLL